MDKLERTITQRCHFHKAIAELNCILEYFTSTEQKEHKEMMEIFEQLKLKILHDSPIA